jgi:hypothetical protein
MFIQPQTSLRSSPHALRWAKTALYRWYSSKEELVAGAIAGVPFSTGCFIAIRFFPEGNES